MSRSSAAVLAARLNRRIARRQRLARWGTHLVIPTIAVIVYAERWGHWFTRAGIVLLALEFVAIASGRLLRCPLCDASLVIGRRGEAQFLEACPECGYLIE